MVEITLLGCGGSMPVPNRFLSSLLINYRGRKILIDCGEGTQVSMKIANCGFKTIDYICITHLHGDHIIGLPGILSTIGNCGRTEMLTIIGPKGIKEVIDACKYYIESTNRRVTFEYSLIKGVNDSIDDANQLSKILKGMLCHVNLIPINKVEERDYEKPDKTYVYKFRDMLNEKNIPATIRREMGADINGACGQLRRKHK
ncbi:Ribonuclease BN [bioreactor metagenome]|uniref:Ribonuclease BN n=1 Tax=bioreactor metagenome TaxID=1076179 RepID=A0A645H695_9ZZZZ